MEYALVFWHIYDYIAILAITLQILFLFNTYQNYHYALKKSGRQRPEYQPRTLLTVPCKGIDISFDENITSLFNLDYDNYFLNLVVEDASDPAYVRLCGLRDRFKSNSKALNVRVLVAGHAVGCSQKIHNLLYSCSNAPDDIEVFAFADSDAQIQPDWLNFLVYPLRKSKNGATTGYRWFVPEKNNLASLVLSSINAKIAQLLGRSIFNQAWGGAMAIRAETFYRIGLDKVWQKALSDDLCLSRTVKKNHMKIVFAPGCLVASYEKTTWPKLLEFTRRQFLITRVVMPGTWCFGLVSSIYALSGLWGGAALAIYAGLTGKANLKLYAAVPVLFFVGQTIRAALRQRMVIKLLHHDAHKMKYAVITDILGNCIWSWVLFGCIVASAFGRSISWRGVRYELTSPTETKILKK